MHTHKRNIKKKKTFLEKTLLRIFKRVIHNVASSKLVKAWIVFTGRGFASECNVGLRVCKMSFINSDIYSLDDKRDGIKQRDFHTGFYVTSSAVQWRKEDINLSKRAPLLLTVTGDLRALSLSVSQVKSSSLCFALNSYVLCHERCTWQCFVLTVLRDSDGEADGSLHTVGQAALKRLRLGRITIWRSSP